MSLVLSGSGSITGLVPGGIPSEDLAYTPAGTGAVETTVQTKLRESVSILDFTGLVASDDWAPAIQAAVDYCAEGAGKTLHFPRGSFTVKSPIFITTNGQHWVGESPGRGTFGKGTQIVFDMASGSCIENGTDDGIAWDSSTDYNGPQLQTFENINFYVKAERRTDALNSVGNYAPGAYGIRDWRGGHIRLNNVTFEGFEYSFWGIKSDFSTLIAFIQNTVCILGQEAIRFQCMTFTLSSATTQSQ